MTIDCSLDNFRYPGLPTYGITFGTKKVSGEGLSTAECCDDMAMPFTTIWRCRLTGSVPTS